ncbi:uncharacterized protein BcabD6B2_47400 [Babesia caballi]|uniref:Uncharacterized protein n=1 Tax=Babesia caballi TaxID=5871 RepID=A0AAV4LZE0_BABCB|nr:hypothetical protein BcabD6B2_47400 [Babesia caballi]
MPTVQHTVVRRNRERTTSPPSGRWNRPRCETSDAAQVTTRPRPEEASDASTEQATRPAATAAAAQSREPRRARRDESRQQSESRTEPRHQTGDAAEPSCRESQSKHDGSHPANSQAKTKGVNLHPRAAAPRSQRDGGAPHSARTCECPTSPPESSKSEEGEKTKQATYHAESAAAGRNSGLVHLSRLGGVKADQSVAALVLEDVVAALVVREGDVNRPVKTAGADQRRVQRLGEVGGAQHDDALALGEPVELNQELVKSHPHAVVVGGRAAGPDGVELVDEHDAGRHRLGQLEELPDAARADANEHLLELGAGSLNEGHAGLPGDRPRQKRLAGAGRAGEQHALGQLGAEAVELLRVAQVGNHLVQLALDLVAALHPLERKTPCAHLDVGEGGAQLRRVHHLKRVADPALDVLVQNHVERAETECDGAEGEKALQDAHEDGAGGLGHRHMDGVLGVRLDVQLVAIHQLAKLLLSAGVAGLHGAHGDARVDAVRLPQRMRVQPAAREVFLHAAAQPVEAVRGELRELETEEGRGRPECALPGAGRTGDDSRHGK